MSVVLPFPGLRAALRGARNPSRRSLNGVHPAMGSSLMSWVCAASCECCGRPTLAGRTGLEGLILCGHCSPPSVA